MRAGEWKKPSTDSREVKSFCSLDRRHLLFMRHKKTHQQLDARVYFPTTSYLSGMPLPGNLASNLQHVCSSLATLQAGGRMGV